MQTKYGLDPSGKISTLNKSNKKHSQKADEIYNDKQKTIDLEE